MSEMKKGETMKEITLKPRTIMLHLTGGLVFVDNMYMPDGRIDPDFMHLSPFDKRNGFDPDYLKNGKRFFRKGERIVNALPGEYIAPVLRDVFTLEEARRFGFPFDEELVEKIKSLGNVDE